MRLTNLTINKDIQVIENILKAFGHKDFGNLQKKEVIDKDGKKRTVYVKNGSETNVNLKSKKGAKLFGNFLKHENKNRENQNVPSKKPIRDKGEEKNNRFTEATKKGSKKPSADELNKMNSFMRNRVKNAWLRNNS